MSAFSICLSPWGWSPSGRWGLWWEVGKWPPALPEAPVWPGVPPLGWWPSVPLKWYPHATAGNRLSSIFSIDRGLLMLLRAPALPAAPSETQWATAGGWGSGSGTVMWKSAQEISVWRAAPHLRRKYKAPLFFWKAPVLTAVEVHAHFPFCCSQ